MNGFVRARIDDDVRNKAAAVLGDIGLSLSDVIRVLITRIANDKAIPVGIFTPNAATISAMTEAKEIITSNTTRFKDAQEMFSALEESARQEKA